MATDSNTKSNKTISVVVLIAVAIAVPIVISIFVTKFLHEDSTKPVTESQITESKTETEVSEENNEAAATTPVVEEKVFDSAKVQAAVDAWAASIPSSSEASVVVQDLSGKTTAQTNQDQIYFTASIYKLFVAYEGYRSLDAGKTKPDDMYLNGNTRLECLDLMIRESNSACGEKMWTEFGKKELTKTFKDYGFEHTDLVSLRVTAGDVVKILTRIAKGEGLSADSQSKFLDSMKDQDAIYRGGIPKGFSSSVTVYDKVGWNELLEYHDGSIIELADGRKLVVVALTSSVGTSRLRQLAGSIETALVK